MGQLLKIKGFLSFISIIFLNAFVDLGHKIIIQNTVFKVYDGQTQIILIAIVNGLILLPFVLLFSPAGFISDRFKKPQVIQASAAAAVFLTLMITVSYYMGWFEVAFAMTFLLAIQSAIYSPSKYGFIKELVGKENLATGNALVQAITIVAILAGIFIFSVFFEQHLMDVTYLNEGDILQNIAPIGWILVALTVVEFLFARQLPETTQSNPEMNFQTGKYLTGKYLKENLQKVFENKTIWLSIVGLSVFWGISQVVLAAFPAYAKAQLAIENTVIIQGILAASGLGIILGSILAGISSKHHIETGLVPLGAIGVVIGMLLLPTIDSTAGLVLNFILFGLSGGLFIVPLNALIQFHAKNDELGTVLAGNNWVQNVVMLSFLAMTAVFAITGLTSNDLFLIMTATAVAGAVYTVYHLPQSLVRFVVGRIFSNHYRIEVLGLDNLPSRGGVLLLGNHISWLDWAMLQIASPRPVRFVMHKAIYQKWFLKWFLDFFGVVPIAGGHSKESLQKINGLLKAGEVVCLFPEGAISRNGQLGEFKKGFEKTVEGVEGVIVPFYLHGLWGSKFSRAGDKLQQDRNTGIRGDVIVTFGNAMPITSAAPDVKQQVFNLSVQSWEAYSKKLGPIPLEWLRTAKRKGSAISLVDMQMDTTLSNNKTMTAVIAFSRLIARYSPEQNIGLMLPTSSAGIITNLAALLQGKTVVNLNFTANMNALKAAVEKAGIKSIYTSQRFVKKLQQRGIELDDLFSGVEVYYLEELKEEISSFTKLLLLSASVLLPANLLYRLFGKTVSTDQAATILFSSGSEGEPKGVVLTHKNLMSNIRQVANVLDTQRDDVVMNSLPLFHAFGLTVTSLMPVVEGLPVICHPDPTDTLNIAKAIAKYKATFFCGTSTFLGMYTRNKRIHPLMLDSLRLVVAGAEKLNREVREGFKLKFHKEIYEGYGATETSPVASVNIPDRIDEKDWHVQTGNKIGTVGLPLPGSSFRIVDPESLETLPIDEDGLILISGVQVMPGYLDNPEKTAESIIELDGKRWYKTGDKGHLDKDGYLTIVDRYSRFAKIAGEMVSLGAIETAIHDLLSEGIDILTTAIPDGKKGEKVVLLYSGDITEDRLKKIIAESTLNALMKPTELLKVDEIPKLGSGKSDFKRAKEMALVAI
jgi:acyl-[acyl-carrier-protein]-phospholipid O-acyltransferase / long-chain-fatty-acid--[acyl-carrier-protein] ligase